MSRRNQAVKRETIPDLRYSSEAVTRLINRVMSRGKKSTAQGVVYDAFKAVEEKAQKPPMEVFEAAMNNLKPTVEVKPRRVGGATLQVPVEVSGYRQESLAMRWLLSEARKRSGKSTAEKLAAEMMDAANNTGAAIKKREETHKMAEANRAFASFRW
ncbi:MAG TPA: 30S ribosomal protein S7 [Thermoflexales bacterium]|nr:30S ribosomal protein S7 [Thermoflexales bacterium]HQW35630.1 30S ribosomal protein S7 [Thermoflexales bacterium]HQX74893.1 30S ribosomal protein S7 [Thermoflexales bacterium]HQZ22040.1 30S ribosomal protein S7 [Thermoflexales bacterium]HQZ99263.1 30S ribosomal protein S7 [Thermoflexales bacterium]